MKKARSASHQPPATSHEKTEIVYGLHAVRHALQQHPQTVLELWLQQGKQSAGALAEILVLAERHGLAVIRPSRDTLDRRAGSGVHQGVLLIRRRGGMAQGADLDGVLAGAGSKPVLLLLLEGVQDPRNLGACLRTAAAAGADAVIIPRAGAVAVNATVRKAASGAAEHIPVITVTNLARTLRALREAGVWIVGAAGDAEQSLFDIDLSVPLAVVMGAEGRGLKANTRKHCDFLARLPMSGAVESLNVAVAAGVCLYEAVRQRGS